MNWGSKKVLFIGIVLWMVGFTGLMARYYAPGLVSEHTKQYLDVLDMAGKGLIALWFGLYMQKKLFPKSRRTITRSQLEADNQRGACPSCGHVYLISDYRKDADVWLCSNCKAKIPKI